MSCMYQLLLNARPAAVPGRFVAILALAAAGAGSAAADSPTTPSESERHTAECVAALDVSTEALAKRVRAGNDGLKPVLLGRLKSGAAFIGTAYLHGERDSGRSRELLDVALAAQTLLTEAELSDRQAACEQEGAKILASANRLERAVVNRVALNRMKRLLAE